MPPPVDDLVTGLKVLRDVKDATVDVVAIHGIGAHPDQTWTDKDADDSSRYISCLTDERMIPKTLPTARILRFGYKSQWFGDPVISTLTTIGDKLTYALEDDRRLQKCEDRPIIFIAHCFGGLVVLRALTHRFRHHIFEVTAGVVFLGTPFRGTHEWFHGQLPKLAVHQHENVKEDILHTLDGKNPTLIELVDHFNKMRSYAGIPKVDCFFEEKPSKVGRILENGKLRRPVVFDDRRDHKGLDTATIEDIVIVDQHSACLDLSKGVNKHSFQRDHFHLNKFSSPDEADFKELSNVLTRFAELAAKDITPELKHRQDERDLHQAAFNEDDWKEHDQFEDFDFSASKEEVYYINFTHKILDNPQSCGLSLNCEFAYLRNTNVVRIYKLSDINQGKRSRTLTRLHAELRPEIPEKLSKKVVIRGVSLGRTTSATIIDNNCFLHRFIEGPNCNVKAIIEKPRENNWEATCVAISETTNEGDLILVAIGLKNWIGKHEGRVELYSVWQNDWNQISKIKTMEIKDTVTGKSDSPRTLNFSLDGALLVCTTTVSNQVHGWRLPTTEMPGTLEHLCETSRQFAKGMNSDGITSAATFLTPGGQKPYVLCTTSPSSERERSVGLEWTFISPLTKPFPPWEASAFHCLTQVQRQESAHRHIHGCAISPQGNLTALIDKQGRILFVPLEANPSGGITSSPVTHLAKAGLGDNNSSMIAIRFNDLGTRLYGINREGKVVVINFPNATEATPLPVLRRASVPATIIGRTLTSKLETSSSSSGSSQRSFWSKVTRKKSLIPSPFVAPGEALHSTTPSRSVTPESVAISSQSSTPQPIPIEKRKHAAVLLHRYEMAPKESPTHSSIQEELTHHPGRHALPSQDSKELFPTRPRRPSGVQVLPGMLSTLTYLDKSGIHARSSGGRKKPLTKKIKAKAALIRYLGACPSCRRREKTCSLSHHDIASLKDIEGAEDDDTVTVYTDDTSPTLSPPRTYSPIVDISKINSTFRPPLPETGVEQEMNSFFDGFTLNPGLQEDNSVSPDHYQSILTTADLLDNENFNRRGHNMQDFGYEVSPAGDFFPTEHIINMIHIGTRDESSERPRYSCSSDGCVDSFDDIVRLQDHYSRYHIPFQVLSEPERLVCCQCNNFLGCRKGICPYCGDNCLLIQVYGCATEIPS